MKWFITGGCGFIGRALANELLGRNNCERIRVFDNLSSGTREDLADVGAFIEKSGKSRLTSWDDPLALVVGDILDAEAIENAIVGADIIIHLAANTGVPQSVENPMQDCKTNVLGTVNLLEAARKSVTTRFVFASSGAPLGVQTPPLHEEMPLHPASPYGASKAAGEAYCSAYFHCFGIETVVLRFGNIYGEGSQKKSSVVAKFIKQTLAEENLEVYGDGSQTRDFIHISDLVSAICLAAETPRIGGETFQIATSRETSVSEIAEKLMEVMQDEGLVPTGIFHGERRKGDVERNFSDTSKAQQLLGWEAKVSLNKGLRETVRYFSKKAEG